MKKMQLTIQQVQMFLSEHYKTGITNVRALSGGQWSQAFAYRQSEHEFVIRFGMHEEDYLKDRFACQFASPTLPIPQVLEVGRAHGGYYAISERAQGTMIDELDKSAMLRVIPSLFETMDAIRNTDISHTTSYGSLDVNGNGIYKSWYDYMVAVADDKPEMKTHGWKAGLAASPVGIEPFEQGFEVLKDIAKELPEVRFLVHNDLLNFNVLVNSNKIIAVIDWANAFYGDFLYDLAQFTFWGPLHEPVKGIDWQAKAEEHYKSIGLEVPEFERRLRVCMLNMGLGAMGYYGYTKDWTYLEPVAERTLALAKG